MNAHQIREYILKYKRKYKKTQIIKSLVNSGYKREDINKIYSELEHSRVEELGKQEKNSPIIVFLVVVLLIISLSMFLYVWLY